MKKLILTLIVTLAVFVKVVAFERTVLTEIFTSTTCPPCATQNPIFDNWLKNSPNAHRIAVIKYHTWWPSPGNDPFYLANTADNSARVSYYGTNYVPRGIINGTNDGTSSASTWITHIQNQLNTTALFKLAAYGNLDSINGGNINIVITSGSTVPTGTLVLHVVIVESDLYYTGTNGDPVHHFVLRKMYPDANGEAFTIGANQSKTITRSITWNSSWKLSNSHIVAFIQNRNTREVYQAIIRKTKETMSKPNLVLPLNGVLNQPVNITLIWNKVSRATNYVLELATDSLFINKLFSDSSLTDTFKTFSKLNRETRYYWRVKALSNSAISDWSETRSFKTIPNTAPAKVTLISPSNGETIPITSPINFTWYVAQPDAEQYLLECATDSNFYNKVIVDSNITQTTTTKQVNQTGKYFWRVKAKNGLGWGEFSDAWWFMSTTSSVKDQIPTDYALFQNYPNPFNPSTTIKFNLAQSGLTSLKIYDMFGKEIRTMINEFLNAGEYVIQFSIDKSTNSSGIYFYELRSNNFVQTKKMVLIK